MNFIFFLTVSFMSIFSTYGLVGHSGEGDKINGDTIIVDKIILREAYIQKISEQFKLSNIVVVHGLAGMGKSNLVQSFIKMNKDHYQKILLINWDRLSFNEQLLRITKTLRPNPDEGSFSLEEGFIKGLKDFPDKILLIIDNLDGLEDIKHLIDALKDLPNINVLLATRTNTTLYPSIKLGVFEKNESKMVLKGVAPALDEESASRIAEALAHYPYFVVKVGKMINLSPTVNAKRLLDILNHQEKDVSLAFLNREEYIETQGKDMQSRGARAILEKIKGMRTKNAQSFEALVFLSHLNTRTIPIDLLHHYFGDENVADKSIKFLIDNDFITSTDKGSDFITFDIHQITQDIVKSTISDKEREEVFHKIPKAFIKFYHQNFSVLIDGDREDQVYYSHLVKLFDSIKDENLLLPLNVIYLKRSLYSQRDTEEAIKIFAKTESSLQRHALKDTKLLADYLADCIYMKGFMHANNLRKFQQGINDGYKAIKLYESIKNKEGVFKAYTRMAWISLYQDNPEKCDYYLSKLDPKKIPSVENYVAKEYLFVQSWYNLNVRNYSKCIEYSLKGIEINQRSKNIYLGLYFWVQLSYAYAKLGKLDEALKIAEEGLILEQGLFEKEGTLAKASFLYTKALIFLYQQKPLEAKEIIKESLKIFENIMGDTPYQDTAIALRILGEIELNLKNYDEAIKALTGSRKMFEAFSPKNGAFDYAECLKHLSLAWIKAKHRDKFEETYSLLKENFGEDHEEVQNLQSKLIEDGFRYLL